MEIEHARLPVCGAHRLQAALEQAIRIEPEIAAAARRPVAAKAAQGGDRNFHELAVGEGIKSETRLLGDAVKIVVYREGAGTVFVAGLVQDIQRPKIAAGDGKGGGAVAVDGDAAYVFQHSLGPRH